MVSMSSFPVCASGHRTVTLNLFGLESNSFSDEAIALGVMLATHASRALLVPDRLVKLSDDGGDVSASVWSTAVLSSYPTGEQALSHLTQRTRSLEEPAVVSQ
jgi:hypothetical protein